MFYINTTTLFIQGIKSKYKLNTSKSVLKQVNKSYFLHNY